MKVGDEYSTYEEFEEALSLYKKSVSNEYYMRDSRTIQLQRKRYPDTVTNANESLKYYLIRLACVKGGRLFKARNELSSRKNSHVTQKQDCKANIFIRMGPSKQTLKVLELSEDHNHQTCQPNLKRLNKERSHRTSQSNLKRLKKEHNHQSSQTNLNGLNKKRSLQTCQSNLNGLNKERSQQTSQSNLNEEHNYQSTQSNLNQKIKLGAEYSSYEEFEEALSVYKKSVCNEYYMRDVKTIKLQRRRHPDTVNKVNESLKYYYIRLTCIRGGKFFKRRNDQSFRKTKTKKQDCEASIFIRLSPSQQTLRITKLNEKHNHESSQSYFDSLAQQRLKIPETVKVQAKEYLQAGASNKMVLEYIEQQTGCKITPKDLSNLSRRTEKKSFAECIDMLKDTYQCNSIEVWADENSVFRGLFFQDDRMKKYFEAFPEVLFVDSLVDLGMPMYVLMVENGNGLSEVIAVCLLVDEDQEDMEFFIENFKKCNPAWDKVQVVMSDKDRTEGKVFEKHFPTAKLMISLFHVFQTFDREVSDQNMNITTREAQVSIDLLQKLTYAESEQEYNAIYNVMMENVPEIVKEYYEKNWAPITDQWIKYLTFQDLCVSNTTNNWLENLNSNLKSVINEYSSLGDIIQYLFLYLNSFRVEQDEKNSHMLNKHLAEENTLSTHALYSEHLTTFAYEKVEKQLELSDSNADFKNITDDIFLVVTSEGLLTVTPSDCECMFRKTNHLPCKHIFNCRKVLSLPLFESSLCSERWTRVYTGHMLELCKSTFSNNFKIIEPATKKKPKVTNKKRKSMSQLCESNDSTDFEMNESAGIKKKRKVTSKRPKSKQLCESNISNNNDEMVEPATSKNNVKVTNTEKEPMTNEQKFKMVDERGKKMAMLCSDVSTSVFHDRLEIIDNIIQLWSEGKDAVVKNLLSEKFRREEDIAAANIADRTGKLNEEYMYFEDAAIEEEYVVESVQEHAVYGSDEEIQIPSTI